MPAPKAAPNNSAETVPIVRIAVDVVTERPVASAAVTEKPVRIDDAAVTAVVVAGITHARHNLMRALRWSRHRVPDRQQLRIAVWTEIAMPAAVIVINVQTAIVTRAGVIVIAA